MNPHLVRRFYDDKSNQLLTYTDSGEFVANAALCADIVEVIKQPSDYTWQSKVSPDHVESNGVGFWAVQQGEV